MSKKILFICGSLNQTRMMHKISLHLQNYENYFTPYYSDGLVGLLAKISVLNFSILGGQFKNNTLEYLKSHKLMIDENGLLNKYDLVCTCSDLIVPGNIKSSRIILVQEGMTDPQNLLYHLVRLLRLPRWLASTSTTGLSDAYDKFCVASTGYKEFFIKKGVNPDKIEVTGIPNFDNCTEYLKNDFPYHHFVLVATSDTRETFKPENRKRFIKKAVKIAGSKLLIFKLHPNENQQRASREIKKYAPHALIYTSGNAEEMTANCDILITRYSTLAYVGLILGKEVYSSFRIEDLERLMPLQNYGMSAYNISETAKVLLGEKHVSGDRIKNGVLNPLDFKKDKIKLNEKRSA